MSEQQEMFGVVRVEKACAHADVLYVDGRCTYPGCEEQRPAYQSHSDTSRAAASDVKPSSGRLRAVVLDVIREFGPCTDEFIQHATGMNPSTERPRRVELVDAGMVRDTGERGRTSSGRTAVLWGVVE